MTNQPRWQRLAGGFGLLALGLASLAGCGAPAPVAGSFGGPEAENTVAGTIPGELIVKYTADQPTGQRWSYPGAARVEAMGVETNDDTVLVRLPAGVPADAAIAAYQAHGVQFAEAHHRVGVHLAHADSTGDAQAADPLENQQWHVSHLNLPQAWSVTTGSGSVVATIDTGADLGHPDLAGQLIPGPVYAGTGSLPVDGFGHGTHVAGLIAAKRGNGQGGVGVAPDAKVLVIKCLDDQGNGGMFAVAHGIISAARWGASHHQHVIINLSLGGPAGPDPLNWLAGWYAHSKGALLVAAAGNDHAAVGTPARIGDYLAVTATDATDQVASFSNFGPQIAVAAPGVKIWSTTPTYPCAINGMGYPSNYAAISGTSMATPIVSGVAALVWAAHPAWTNDQVRDQLERSAHHLGDAGRNPIYGYGLVDPVAAIAGATASAAAEDAQAAGKAFKPN